jgi:hypothetical protein
VVGILPHQLDLLRSYFKENGLNAVIEPPNALLSRGNWVHVHFDRDVATLSCIEPRIQLSDHLIVGCFMGYFQKEECVPVPVPQKVKEDQKTKFFKMPQMDEDLTALSMKEKSWWLKFREFVLGERHIERRNESFLGSLYQTICRLFMGTGGESSAIGEELK